MSKRTCSVAGCTGPHKGHSYCEKHYQRFKKFGDPNYLPERKRIACKIDGCTEPRTGHKVCWTHLKQNWPGDCDADDCSKPRKIKGLCSAHYARLIRYGAHDFDTFPPRWEDIRGERFGELVVIERDGQNWLCECACGGTVSAYPGHLNDGTRTHCRSEHHRLLDVVGYPGAHERIRRARGLVQTYDCIDCGRQAEHWSYNYQDPTPLKGTKGTSWGLPYSLDVSNYDPRCMRCHWIFDQVTMHEPKMKQMSIATVAASECTGQR